MHRRREREGTARKPQAVATKLFETTVWRVAGEWKVVENVLVARWEGVDGCADFS